MTKCRILLTLVVFNLMMLFALRAVSWAQGPRSLPPIDTERWRNMTETERKRILARRREQARLANQQRRKEAEARRFERSPRPKSDREQREKDTQERLAKIRKELFFVKKGLKASEEHWKAIKPILEEIQRLQIKSCSSVGLLLTSSSGDGLRAIEPAFQWKISWKDKAPAELTEAQRIANDLVDLVDKKNTTSEEFTRKMAALRESRSALEKQKSQLAEARRELRELLTTRQEAVLVLMGWLGCRDDFD